MKATDAAQQVQQSLILSTSERLCARLRQHGQDFWHAKASLSIGAYLQAGF